MPLGPSCNCSKMRLQTVMAGGQDASQGRRHGARVQIGEIDEAQLLRRGGDPNAIVPQKGAKNDQELPKPFFRRKKTMRAKAPPRQPR